MKRSMFCLVLMGAILLTIKLTFAQDVLAVNENNPDMVNQEEVNNSELTGIYDNAESNADTTAMPFIPQDNSENNVSNFGNETN